MIVSEVQGQTNAFIHSNSLRRGSSCWRHVWSRLSSWGISSLSCGICRAFRMRHFDRSVRLGRRVGGRGRDSVATVQQTDVRARQRAESSRRRFFMRTKLSPRVNICCLWNCKERCIDCDNRAGRTGNERGRPKLRVANQKWPPVRAPSSPQRNVGCHPTGSLQLRGLRPSVAHHTKPQPPNGTALPINPASLLSSSEGSCPGTSGRPSLPPLRARE
jgi:hypothetical protein